jgi:two-component system, LytTR family, sensor kinase
MQASFIAPLTSRQKWQLAFGLAIIYVPLRIYMNVALIDQAIFFHKLPLWIMELLITTVFFTIWIRVIEWLQQYIVAYFGEAFFDDFRFLNQLFTLLIAIVLAVVFNLVFRVLWHGMEMLWEQQGVTDMLSIKVPDQLPQKRRANNSITVMALMAVYYLATHKRVYQKLQQVHINEERLEKENIKAHFNALKNQISPHFLFNNFSVLTSLVETNQELSVEFIHRLSKAYRYILEQSDYDDIKLSKEIDFLETYIFLLKIRFEDKLQLHIAIPPPDQERYSIVPLTLQLLVENAVKHNQMSASTPLKISIYMEGDFLAVSNPLQIRELSEPSTKLGLHNIINRYRLLINRPVMVSQEDNQFIVRIPLFS